MIDMTKFEGCLFCGDTDVSVQPAEAPRCYFVACEVCAARGPISESQDEAIIRWNTRVFPGVEIPRDVVTQVMSRCFEPGDSIFGGHHDD